MTGVASASPQLDQTCAPDPRRQLSASPQLAHQASDLMTGVTRASQLADQAFAPDCDVFTPENSASEKNAAGSNSLLWKIDCMPSKGVI